MGRNIKNTNIKLNIYFIHDLMKKHKVINKIIVQFNNNKDWWYLVLWVKNVF